MKKLLGMTALVSAVAGFAVPAVAQQMDAATLTCGEFLAMAAGGKDEATNAVTVYVADAANADTTAAAAQIVAGMEQPEAEAQIEASCVGKPPETLVVLALQETMK